MPGAQTNRPSDGIVTVSGCGRLAGGGRDSGGMKPPPDPHCRHRFPAEIISHAVWLYHVFSLSLQDVVELLLAERGIVVSCETVRRWCKKFGQRLRQPPAPPPATPGGQVAPGRGVDPDPRACSATSGAPLIRRVLYWTFWCRSGGMPSRQAFLSAAAEGPAVCAAGYRDRQAAKLRRGAAPGPSSGLNIDKAGI